MTIMARYWVYCFSTLPVIVEVAKESVSVLPHASPVRFVASQVAISGSPISAAMAAMLTIMEVNGVSFIRDVGMSSHLFCCRDGRRFYCFPTGM